MARNISIMISARDNMSETLKNIRNSQTAFRNDTKKLTEELNVLNKSKVRIQTDFAGAEKALRDAKKAFQQTGDEASRLQLINAQSDYNNIKSNLNAVSKAAQQTEKDLSNLSGVMSKTENRAGSASAGISGSGSNVGLGKQLAQAGALKVLGDTAANIAGAYIGSAYGSNASAMFGSTLSLAGTGAAIGSAIAPGIGTAIGAVGGATLGLINGAAEINKTKDDAFKSVVQDTYETIQSSRSEDLSSGSGIASQREQSLISFTTLFGDADKASGFLKEINHFANVTPFLFDDLTSMSKTLSTYGYQAEELIPLMTKIGDAGAALGMDTASMNAVAQGLGRMTSSGKTTLEYLNPLLERGIPVWDYLAKASGKTKEETMEMVSKGLVPGAEAARAIADYMGAAFEGSMEAQSKTYAGLSSTLQGMKDEMSNAMGEGYNEERKKGIETEINYLSGQSGEIMKEANRMIGQFQASLENAKEEAIRNALDSAMSSEEYQKAKLEGDGAEAGRILAEAQAKGLAEYTNSEGYQLKIETDKALIQNTRDALANSYWEAGYELQQEMNKGIAAAGTEIDRPWKAYVAEVKAFTGTETLDDVIARGIDSGMPGILSFPPKAVGMSYVPYDNYPALLHQGERVMTAAEVRAEKGGGNITVTGNSFVVREEADIQKIASEILRQARLAQMIST